MTEGESKRQGRLRILTARIAQELPTTAPVHFFARMHVRIDRAQRLGRTALARLGELRSDHESTKERIATAESQLGGQNERIEHFIQGVDASLVGVAASVEAAQASSSHAASQADASQYAANQAQEEARAARTEAGSAAQAANNADTRAASAHEAAQRAQTEAAAAREGAREASENADAAKRYAQSASESAHGAQTAAKDVSGQLTALKSDIDGVRDGLTREREAIGAVVGESTIRLEIARRELEAARKEIAGLHASGAGTSPETEARITELTGRLVELESAGYITEQQLGEAQGRLTDGIQGFIVRMRELPIIKDPTSVVGEILQNKGVDATMAAVTQLQRDVTELRSEMSKQKPSEPAVKADGLASSFTALEIRVKAIEAKTKALEEALGKMKPTLDGAAVEKLVAEALAKQGITPEMIDSLKGVKEDRAALNGLLKYLEPLGDLLKSNGTPRPLDMLLQLASVSTRLKLLEAPPAEEGEEPRLSPFEEVFDPERGVNATVDGILDLYERNVAPAIVKLRRRLRQLEGRKSRGSKGGQGGAVPTSPLEEEPTQAGPLSGSRSSAVPVSVPVASVPIVRGERVRGLVAEEGRAMPPDERRDRSDDVTRPLYRAPAPPSPGTTGPSSGRAFKRADVTVAPPSSAPVVVRGTVPAGASDEPVTILHDVNFALYVMTCRDLGSELEMDDFLNRQIMSDGQRDAIKAAARDSDFIPLPVNERILSVLQNSSHSGFGSVLKGIQEGRISIAGLDRDTIDDVVETLVGHLEQGVSFHEVHDALTTITQNHPNADVSAALYVLLPTRLEDISKKELSEILSMRHLVVAYGGALVQAKQKAPPVGNEAGDIARGLNAVLEKTRDSASDEVREFRRILKKAKDALLDLRPPQGLLRA